MEKKYLVVVYRKLRSTSDYKEFTDKHEAENWYKYILNAAKEQKDEDKDKPYYILAVRLCKLIDIGE